MKTIIVNSSWIDEINFKVTKGPIAGLPISYTRGLNVSCEVLCKITYTRIFCIVFKYLYSAPQQPWANRGAFSSISSKKRDKF